MKREVQAIRKKLVESERQVAAAAAAERRHLDARMRAKKGEHDALVRADSATEALEETAQRAKATESEARELNKYCSIAAANNRMKTAVRCI